MKGRSRAGSGRLRSIAIAAAVSAAAMGAAGPPGAAGAEGAQGARAAQADQQSVHRIAGLKEPVTINVDTWGVPHIFAKNTEDAFLAQGFNAARDRLFQIDLSHRRGLGKLSEVFGPSYVEQDRATRLFLYRGDMQAEWDAYGPDTEEITTRFASGVNAYIDWVEQHPEHLPPEFRMLDYKPDRWAPEDVVKSRTHALVSGLSAEVNRAKLACAGAMDLDPLRKRLEPAHTAQVPAGLDPCLPADILKTYTLATQPVAFTGDAARPVAAAKPGPAGPGGAEGAEEVLEGSNNWTISGDRTSTGRPILANDPHRVHQTPSLRYITHLSSPEMNVIGAGEPALPGISIGHNDSIAFGLTVFGIDAQDLYQYELNSDNTAYRYQGGWVPFENATESVAVRGGEPQQVQLQYTQHGPVIHVDKAKHRAYALRSTWSEPGTNAYFASIGYMRAKNWDEFLATMKNWGTPGENQVYADTAGNIGWKPGGMVPRRTGYDGLLPVPGDGRYEWSGFLPSEDLPQEFNPDRGFFASANQFNLPAGTPADKVTSYEWTGPDRHDRIMSVLNEQDPHTLQDSARLQQDVVSPRAQALLDLIRPLSSNDPTTAKALDFMSGWNGSEHLGSQQATLYQGYWEKRVNTAIRDALVPAERRSLLPEVDWLVARDVLASPQEWLGADAVAKRDGILLDSLKAAYQAAASELGQDTSAWGYRGNSRVMLHPLGGLDPSLNVGPYPIPGSSTTPIASGNASFKEVIDVGNWDASLALNTPGQSGVPGSDHYKDLAQRWSEGRHFPMLYSRGAIEKNTESRILLLPAG